MRSIIGGFLLMATAVVPVWAADFTVSLNDGQMQYFQRVSAREGLSIQQLLQRYVDELSRRFAMQDIRDRETKILQQYDRAPQEVRQKVEELLNQ